jgi:hypothetical protein
MFSYLFFLVFYYQFMFILIYFFCFYNYVPFNVNVITFYVKDVCIYIMFMYIMLTLYKSIFHKRNIKNMSKFCPSGTKDKL